MTAGNHKTGRVAYRYRVDITQAVKISDDVYWVGAIDWDLRNFHGYETPRGSSYNAYLITGERNVLIDTVKHSVVSQLRDRVASVIDLEEVDLIVSNHTEMDHSASLKEMQRRTGARILASRRGVENLAEHYEDLEMEAVEDGQEISIGQRTLRFVETPMLHWPDSMFTYIVEDGILFSMDGFGQHWASGIRFDDQVDECTLMYEAAKYYANILLPFGRKFLKVYEKVKDLELNMIAPSHGIIWRTKIGQIVEAYLRWARGETGNRVVIAYDTMWGSTKTMAEEIAEGVASKGVEVSVHRLKDTERSEVMTEVLEAGALLVGSPTINNCIFPQVADFVEYMKGLRPKGRVGAAFGSYGWGGGAVRSLQDHMKKAGLIMLDGLQVKYVPGEEDREECFQLGEAVADRLLERSK